MAIIDIESMKRCEIKLAFSFCFKFLNEHFAYSSRNSVSGLIAGFHLLLYIRKQVKLKEMFFFLSFLV